MPEPALNHIQRAVLAQLDDHWQMASALRVGGRTQNQIVWALQSLRRLGLVTYTVTLRQLFYRFVALDLFPPDG